MKQLKAQVFTDSDFPHHLFVRFHNGRIACARLLTRSLHKDRGIWHYYLYKKSGVSTTRVIHALAASVALCRNHGKKPKRLNVGRTSNAIG